MPAKGSCCTCGPCEAWSVSACRPLTKCVPRYLCVSSLGETSYGCRVKFNAVLIYNCYSDVELGLLDTWTQDPADPPPERSHATVSVQLICSEDEYGTVTAVTRVQIIVEGSEPEYVYYDGILEFPDVIEIIDGNGVAWEFNIRLGGGVPHPYATMPCAPCKCTTCLPASYCVQVQINSVPSAMQGFNCGQGLFNVLLEYDCGLRQYKGDPLVIGDLTLEFEAEPLTTSCAVKFSISGANFPVDGTIVTDSGFYVIVIEQTIDNLCEGGTVDAFECFESEIGGVPRTSGGNCVMQMGCSPRRGFTSDIVTDYGEILGSIAVKGIMCGEECSPAKSTICNGACPTIDERSLYCNPLTLYASFVVADCEYQPDPIPLPQNGTSGASAFDFGSNCQRYGAFTGNLDCNGASGYFIRMALWYIPQTDCETEGVDLSRYRLYIEVSGVPCDFFGEGPQIQTLTPLDSSTCSPFSLEFESELLGRCYGLTCCPSATGSVIVRVTL